MSQVTPYDQLKNSFSESELHDLCHDLQINFDDLPGDTHSRKVRELVEYCRRRGRIGELTEMCRTLRPRLDWQFDAEDQEWPGPSLTYASIAIEEGNPDWHEAAEFMQQQFYQFGQEPAYRFHTYHGGQIECPSFDITVLNRELSPVILTDVGLEILSITQCRRGGGGLPPMSVKVTRSDAYIVRLPNLSESLEWDEQENQYVPQRVNQVIKVGLPDPIYMQSLAPYRFTLVLGDYSPNMPSDAIVRLWARTDSGEVKSPVVQLLAL